MNAATVDPNHFNLVQRDTHTLVIGTIKYDPISKMATFSPVASLKNRTAYRATIAAAVKDQVGNEMGQPRTWDFTVAQQDTHDNQGSE